MIQSLVKLPRLLCSSSAKFCSRYLLFASVAVVIDNHTYTAIVVAACVLFCVSKSSLQLLYEETQYNSRLWPPDGQQQLAVLAVVNNSGQNEPSKLA